MTQVMRDPVGVASKANVIDDGMFLSSALSSPSCASNELIGFTAVLTPRYARGIAVARGMGERLVSISVSRT